ncbi:hypothetical protein JMJ77_0005378, partial [Colletotrichum scovillei]
MENTTVLFKGDCSPLTTHSPRSLSCVRIRARFVPFTAAFQS